MVKTCCRCNQEKPVACFGKTHRSKDGFRYHWSLENSMVALLKGLKRLQVKEWSAPITEDKVLGLGIDVITDMPDSHLSCTKCGSSSFEVWVYGDNHRIEVGCKSCGWSTRLLLPMDVDLSKRFGQGKFECFKHKDAGFIIVKNIETLCIGCQYCRTEVRLDLKTKSNIILAN